MYKIKLYKVTSYILGIISFCGFMLLLGSIGAVEHDRISMVQFMNQTIYGLLAFTVGEIGAILAHNQFQHLSKRGEN